MFNLGSRAFFVAAPFALVCCVLYSFNSSDIGGFVLLLGAALVAVMLGATSLAATGTADRFTVAGLQDPRTGRAPTASAVPLLLAVAAGTLVLGAALGVVAYAIGLVLAAIAALLWFMASWRDHPDHIDALTPRISDRLALPFGMPVALIALIGIIAVSLSRILLSVSKDTSTAIALMAALVIFASGFALAAKPKIDKRLLRALTVVALLAVIGLGIVGLSKGERKFGEENGGATSSSTK